MKFDNVHPAEAKAWEDFLYGRQGAKKTAELLGISHQQVINRSATMFRDGIQRGVIKVHGTLVPATRRGRAKRGVAMN